MGTREEPRDLKVVSSGEEEEVEVLDALENTVENDPPKKRDLPSSDGVMLSTGPFSPAKTGGDQLLLAVDH